MKYAVIIVAAGSGTRMKLGYNKVYARLQDGRTLLEHTMDVFMQDEDCTELVIATDGTEYLHEITWRMPGRIVLVQGGSTRQGSVYNALLAVKEDTVFVHDGARPYLRSDELNLLKETMETEDAALLCVPCKDTVKRIENGYIKETYVRDTLRCAQTPQAFRTALLTECIEKAMAEGFIGTDDCSLVERFSDVPVRAVEGSYTNIKITTPEDLAK